MSSRTCSKCGKPEIRRHRHADPIVQANIRYGRFVAWMEREQLRQLVRRALITRL